MAKKKRIATPLWGNVPKAKPKKVKKKVKTKKVKTVKLKEEPRSLIGPKRKKISEIKEKKTGSDLFNFIKLMFNNKKEFDRTTLYNRGKYAFMIQRYMSIMYPIEANMLDRIGINQGEVTSFWEMMVGRANSRQPSWMWTKIKKKTSISNTYEPPKELALLYRKIHELDLKTFDELLERYPEDMEKTFNEMQEYIS